MCMFPKIMELFIQFFIMDEIIQIFQIFFCALVIFYEIKKIVIYLLIAFLKILMKRLFIITLMPDYYQ